MLIGKINPGSGLGDQLFSYIITRVIALDRGFDYGFVGKEFFKGASFMDLDWGSKNADNIIFQVEQPSGKIIIDTVTPSLFEINTPYYNPEVNFVQDGTIIDGYGAQDERYWGHRLDEIKEWLKTDYIDDSGVGIINFRGGEYQVVPELFLLQEYWDKAIEIMKPKVNFFAVQTDDPDLASKFFPELIITKDIATNWKHIRYAKNAIISNSAFAIIPRLLKHLEDPEAVTIAPRYWAGRNVGEWRRPGNYYKKFTYI